MSIYIYIYIWLHFHFSTLLFFTIRYIELEHVLANMLLVTYNALVGVSWIQSELHSLSYFCCLQKLIIYLQKSFFFGVLNFNLLIYYTSLNVRITIVSLSCLRCTYTLVLLGRLNSFYLPILTMVTWKNTYVDSLITQWGMFS